MLQLRLFIVALLALATTASDAQSYRGGRTTSRTAHLLGRLPVDFVATLAEPGRSIVGREMNAGTAPFEVLPASTGSPPWSESGIDAILQSSPTVTSVTGAGGYIQLVSGSIASSQTAGIFTTEIAPRAFDPAAGFVVSTIVSQTPNPLNVRGALLMIASGFDVTAPTLNPRGLVDGIGWGHDPTDAVADGWFFCAANSCVPLGTAAPRDGRDYYALLVLDAGATSGYRLLIDLSGPRVADQGTFTRGSAATRFLEINASPGASGTTNGPARTMRVAWIRGVRARAALASWSPRVDELRIYAAANDDSAAPGELAGMAAIVGLNVDRWVAVAGRRRRRSSASARRLAA